jgi:hypothetical protein
MMPSEYTEHCGYNEIDIMEMIDGNTHVREGLLLQLLA